MKCWITVLVMSIIASLLLAHSPVIAQDNCPTTKPNPPEITLSLYENGKPVGAQRMLGPLLDYLNGGGSSETLSESLDKATQIGEAQNSSKSPELFWRWRIEYPHLFSAQSHNLLVEIAGFGGKREDNFMDAALFAFICRGGSMVGYLVGKYGGMRGGKSMGGENGLFAVLDMTGDGLDEMVVTLVSDVGSIGYYREFMIYGWNGEQFILLIPPFEGLGSAQSTAYVYRGNGVFKDTDGDGTLELVLTGEAWIGSNIYDWSRLDRGDELTWRWNGTQFALVCKREATPAQFRVQLLVDATDALGCSDVKGAIADYGRIIDDDTLLHWTEADNECPGCDPASGEYANTVQVVTENGTSVPDPAEWPRLAAYAHFRLMVIYAHEGNLEWARLELAALQALTGDAPGRNYAAWAEIFWQQFEETGEVGTACQTLTASTTDAITSPLVDYNFLIYDVLDESVCPF